MDVLYELLGIFITLGFFVFIAMIQETLIKKYLPSLYNRIVHDDEEL